MKQLLLIILTACLLIGCGESNEEPLTDVVFPAAELDTFAIGNTLINVSKSDASSFWKVQDVSWDTSETNNLSKDSLLVKRSGDTLIFLVRDSATVRLVNNPVYNDEYVSYCYLGYLPGIGQYVTAASYYEWYDYILIDRQTGDTTITWGLPVVSPDKKHFICGNLDLVAGFTPNGFQLFLNSHKPQLLGERELTLWGPANIKWLNNTTLLVEAEVSDTTDAELQRQEYFKLEIRNKE